MKHVAIKPPDAFDRLMDVRHRLADTRSKLGETIHGLNLAANAIETLGGDGSIYRELAEDAKALRWAA